MKKIKFFSFASALMLAGAMGFSSCSSDSDVVEGGSGVAGQTVKTQFAINIPYGNEPSNEARPNTRMTSDITQANGNFRGIENMRLFTYTDEPSDNQSIGSKIILGSDANAFSTSSDSKVKVYRDVSIPVGTKTFTLYAQAKASSNSGDQFSNGALRTSSAYRNNSNLSTSDIEFSLNAIAPSANFTENADAKKLIDALNLVVGTSYYEGDDQGGTTIYWSDYASENGQAATGNADVVAKNLYNKFTKLTAGSALSIKQTLQNLQSQAQDDTSAKTILTYIQNNCKTALENIKDVTFPSNLNLPDGVARIHFDETTDKFVFDDTNVTMGTGNNINYTKITYPASLAYFVKTNAMVSNEAFNTANNFPSSEKWSNGDNDAWTSNTSFKEGTVEASTRTIGLKDPLQYAVANMKLSIKSANTLEDNGQKMGNLTTNQTISVASSGFPVTGILVGGQPEKVGWNFEPKAGEKFETTIYDKNMNTSSGSSFYTSSTNAESTNYNYTLVLDNNNLNADQQNVVYVTVELTNNTGKDFYGADGMIPAGGTFYLIGTLDVNKVGTNGNKPNGIDHVFVKDCTTEVNMTIKDLKNAYNCIPDLRSSLISIGLAVNLKWQNGIKFDIDI